MVEEKAASSDEVRRAQMDTVLASLATDYPGPWMSWVGASPFVFGAVGRFIVQSMRRKQKRKARHKPAIFSAIVRGA